jgi:ribulose-5-phosphate 4-epimerase/fuculose-1-phosphate aldolase
MATGNQIQQVKNDVITSAQMLTNRGICEAFGHVSARIPGTDLFVITPRSSLMFVKKPEDLVTVDLNGERVEGSNTQPLETWLHTCIYRRRKDVGGIARTHSFTTSSFSILGEPIKPVHDFGAVLLMETPVFMDSHLIENSDIGDRLAEFIGETGTAALLRGNGTAVLGKDIVEATIRAIYLDQARQLGTPIYFSEAETAQRGNQLLEASHVTRAWAHYKKELRSR